MGQYIQSEKFKRDGLTPMVNNSKGNIVTLSFHLGGKENSGD